MDKAELQQLEREIGELAAQIQAATYRLLELLRRYDEQGTWADGGFKTCAAWLSWYTGIDLGAAREKVRVCRALPALPQTSDALRRGELSYSKVRALTRVATPDNEEDLLVTAKHGTTAHVEWVVRAYRKERAMRQLADRSGIRQLGTPACLPGMTRCSTPSPTRWPTRSSTVWFREQKGGRVPARA